MRDDNLKPRQEKLVPVGSTQISPEGKETRPVRRESWAEIISAQLEVRHRWRQGDALEASGASTLNDSDAFILGGLARFAQASRILVDTDDLADRLHHCHADNMIAIASLGEQDASSHDLCIFDAAISANNAVSFATQSPALVLLYGWGQTWTSGAAVAAMASDTISVRPLSGCSPSLWKSSLVLVTTDEHRQRASHGLAGVVDLLADKSLDPFFLLDQLQQHRSTSNRPDVSRQETEHLEKRILELEQEIAELRRFALLQQESLVLMGGGISSARAD